MKTTAIYISAFVLLALVTAIHVEGHDVYRENTTDAEKIELMQRGIGAVKSRLKNPSSAQFRNVHFHLGSSGVQMTCGEVNSKDSLGDYTGFQKFISAGTP